MVNQMNLEVDYKCVAPEEQIYGVLGAVFPHFCTRATCRPCGMKNPFLDHRVNAIPACCAALRAGLPVIIIIM